MQINNFSPAASQISSRITPADNSASAAVIEQRQQTQISQQVDNAVQVNQRSRFDVDQQTLTVLDQQQQKTLGQQASNQQQVPSYDQPSNKNQTAVAAYQAVDNITQRASIEQSFGIDLLV